MNERGHILTILLTGGIGSGKSLAAKCLVEFGVPVYDFDSRTKELYDSDRDLCGRVAEAVRPHVEEEVLTEDGRLDRKVLARTLFGNSAALEALETVVHPTVLADFRKWREECSERFAEALASGEQRVVSGCLVSEKRGVRKLTMPMVAAESAIALSKPLFAGEFDKVILITAPEDVRKSRVVARDGLSETEVEARMRTQSTPEGISSPTEGAVASPKVDYIIENDGEKAKLVLKIINVLMDILKLMN